MRTAHVTRIGSERFRILIGSSCFDGFALVWRGEERLDFRHETGPEIVSLADPIGAGETLPKSFEADVLNLTHPDDWGRSDETAGSTDELDPVPAPAMPADDTAGGDEALFGHTSDP